MSFDVRTKRAAPSAPSSTKVTQYTDTVGRTHILDGTGIDNVLTATQKYNYVRNSGMWFAQRQTPGTATTYFTAATSRLITADGFGECCENASMTFCCIDTSGAYESGLQSRFWGEFIKITSAGKLMVTQVIEGMTGYNLRGRVVRVTVLMKGVVGLTLTMRLGLIQLNVSGTLDTMPATTISAYGANGTDPTLGTNLARITPVAGVTGDNCTLNGAAYDCSVTGSWQRFSGVFLVPTDAKNIIPAVWTNAQLAATNGFGLSQVMLTDGYETQDWSPQSYQEEMDRVLRFYQKTFPIDTAPVQNGGLGGALQQIAGKAGAVALAAQGQWQYETRLRAAATTLTTYNPQAANAQARRVSGAASADQTATATANSSERAVEWTATGDAVGVVGDRVILHMSADAEL